MTPRQLVAPVRSKLPPLLLSPPLLPPPLLLCGGCHWGAAAPRAPHRVHRPRAHTACTRKASLSVPPFACWRAAMSVLPPRWAPPTPPPPQPTVLRVPGPLLQWVYAAVLYDIGRGLTGVAVVRERERERDEGCVQAVSNLRNYLLLQSARNLQPSNTQGSATSRFCALPESCDTAALRRRCMTPSCCWWAIIRIRPSYSGCRRVGNERTTLCPHFALHAHAFTILSIPSPTHLRVNCPRVGGVAPSQV